ncbi:hypothetical protein [uncultured Lacinutrix sp.]|uniref:hypothetical protein n=1 Tax=uncultured Lacinutrix sp. TaxID=574032 RepID=UPI00261A6EA0|nr:hypothetical protein [uncultured Lacinutrix sp.]
MKFIKNTFASIFCVIAIVSCSDESIIQDENAPGTNVTGNYFPSTVNDYWKYTVENIDDATGETIVANDSLYVATQTASNFTLGVNDNMIANGAMNGLLTSGELTRTDATLVLNGVLQLPQGISDITDFEINLDNVILYNVNANTGDVLSTVANTLQQDFNGFPITINYTLSTIAQGFSETLNLNGQNYNDVTSTQLKLNLSVSTSIPVGPISVDVSILDAQDVLVSNNYFAKDIGLVNSQTNTMYEISAAAITALEAAGVTIDIPESSSSSNSQVLTNHMVTE